MSCRMFQASLDTIGASEAKPWSRADSADRFLLGVREWTSAARDARVVGKLYVAFELGDSTGDLCLGEGVRSPRRGTVYGGETAALLKTIGRAKMRSRFLPSIPHAQASRGGPRHTELKTFLKTSRHPSRCSDQSSSPRVRCTGKRTSRRTPAPCRISLPVLPDVSLRAQRHTPCPAR